MTGSELFAYQLKTGNYASNESLGEVGFREKGSLLQKLQLPLWTQLQGSLIIVHWNKCRITVFLLCYGNNAVFLFLQDYSFFPFAVMQYYRFRAICCNAKLQLSSDFSFAGLQHITDLWNAELQLMYHFIKCRITVLYVKSVTTPMFSLLYFRGITESGMRMENENKRHKMCKNIVVYCC